MSMQFHSSKEFDEKMMDDTFCTGTLKEAVKMYYEQLFQTNEAKMNFVKGVDSHFQGRWWDQSEEQTFFIDAALALVFRKKILQCFPL